MKYDRFEEMPVWRAASDLGDRVVTLLERAYFGRRRGLADQLDRAAISITNNIAEGFERGTTAEMIAFVYYARGSAGEVRSMLRGLARRAEAAGSEISDLKFEISSLIQLSENISRQLRGWADHLQNTEIAGQRRLTKESKEAWDRRQRAAAFAEQLRKNYPIPRADGRPQDGGLA